MEVSPKSTIMVVQKWDPPCKKFFLHDFRKKFKILLKRDILGIVFLRILDKIKTTMVLLLQLILNGIVIGTIYGIIALGLLIVYRGMKIFHIAHGAIFTLSCYMFYTFCRLFHFSVFISIPLTLLSVIAIAYFIEKLVYKPLSEKKASSEVSLIVSFGVYIILVNSIALFYGNETKLVFDRVFSSYTFLGITLTSIQIIQFLISLGTFVAIYLLLKKTNIGKAITAIAENSFLAEVIGIDIWKLRKIMIALSAFLAGIAGILISADIGMDPWGGMNILLSGAVAMIIGGIERWEGASVGGLLLGIIQAVSIWKFSVKWQNVTTFLVLFVFLLFRPQGILTEKKRI